MTIDKHVTDADDPILAAAVAPEEPARGTSKKTGKRKAWWRRTPIKRTTVVVHRWLSLLLGLILLVITTSGALVVYSPEWTVWTNSSTFQVHETASPISFSRAIAVVDQAHPDFQAGSVNVYHGLYEVGSADAEAHPGWYGVDPGNGQITGQVIPDRGVMAFMNQVHECFFTCEDYPGYVAFLNHPVPTFGMGWLTDVTWGGVILGLAGLLLIFLAVSGIWLWWPTLKKWRHGFRVRWSRGRYARDYDLHQTIGMVAVPFLLIWGLTGASFEFTWVSSAWYAVTGGHSVEDETFTSNPVKNKNTPDITLDAATVAAQAKAGSDAKLVAVYPPDPDDQTAAYQFWFGKGFDDWGHGAYPGDYSVSVDRHDATHLANDYSDTSPTWSNQFMDKLAAPMFHYGQSFNGWWRIAWFLFGLTPLVLAVTGVSTWLAKRSVRKRRKKLTARRLADSSAAATGSAGSVAPAAAPAVAPAAAAAPSVAPAAAAAPSVAPAG